MMSILLDRYLQLQGKPFRHLSKKGKAKVGLIDDFDTPIWVEKFGIAPIKCEPDYAEIHGDEFKKKAVQDDTASEPLEKLKGKKEESSKIYGVPITKLEVTEKGIDNPITVEEVIAAFKFFKVPVEHFKGLEEIIISNELPGKKWAFGTYNIRKRGKEFLDNRMTIWAQKVEMMNGEKRYIVHPSNASGPLFLTSSRFHYEILGDTLIHELGHHFDLWINESPMGTGGWVARAEQFAERYARSFSAIRRRSEEFLNLMIQYGDDDNKNEIEKMDKSDPNAVQDVEMTDKK